MTPKYIIEYTVPVGKYAVPNRYQTDGPVSCTEFLSNLLEHGFHIKAIMHEGMPLETKQADQIIKQAASMLAARHVCASLCIDAAEEHHRFGFAA